MWISKSELKAVKGKPAAFKLNWIITTERDVSYAEAARQMSVTPAGLLNWVKSIDEGGRSPDHPYRKVIRLWTENSVLGPIELDEWETDDERSIVQAGKPYVPPAAAPDCT
jgi:transposase-like protein